MLSRRTFLAGAVATAAGVPLAGSVLRAKRAGATAGLATTVVNHTNRFANTAVALYVVGTDLATGQQSYVDRNGTLRPVSAGLNGPDGFADLSIPLAADGDTHLTLPSMSGRIYVSIDGLLKFTVVTDGAGRAALQYPAGWVSGDPSFGVLHDCVEFTLNDAGMFCNTTMVDMLSVPLAIDLVGAATQRTGMLVDGGRDAIFAALAAQPGFERLVLGDGLRVIAPGHGLDAGLFATDYFAAAVDAVWSRYAGTDLTVTTDAGTRTGRVAGDRLTLSGGVAPIARPSTRDILYCDGALAAPNDGVTGPVAAVLGAAFNRSTLLDSAAQPVTDPAAFYRQPVTNHYARLMHENTVDGKAYGFAFDDVSSFASYVQDGSPSSFTVTLTPFGSAAGTA